ncbi:MAG TPA: LamG domain-containing protein [Verrucomicrobiae bacterium]|nr:LamG domain-containing protein [Verrucomicrobiae bacterium]
MSTKAADGPIAVWKAEGNANDSAGTADGTLLNGTSFAPTIVPAETGQAFSLDGIDDEIRFPASPALNITTGLTVCGWVRTTGTAAFSGLLDRFTQGGETTGFQVSMSGDNGFPPNRSGILRADLGVGTGYTTAFNLKRVDDGIPHHFALVWDGLQALLYVDGTAGDPTLVSDFVPANSTDIVLGSDTDGAGRHFNGQLDEIAIFDRPLSTDEVLALAGTPRLNIVFTAPNSVLVSWPAVATGFRLQANQTFDFATWATAASQPDNKAFFSPTAQIQFYRLIKP